MPDLAHLIGSLLVALLTGTWQPAAPDVVALAPAPVQFSASWHPLGQAGNELDALVVTVDGALYGGATSSAISSPRH